MSTSSTGEANRSFIIGTRLCPPASTLASSPPSLSRAIASSRECGASYRNRDGNIQFLRSAGVGVGNGLRPRLVVGVGARLLVRRPRAGDGLPGDLEVVNELRPRPHGRALARLRRVLDELVQPGIVPAVTVGFDGHATISRR